MALKHAVLASLLSGSASGYELAKRMDRSVANFWPAIPQQIYTELRRLEADGLVNGEDVVQRGRPNKRVYEITAGGRRELHAFLEATPRPTTIRDELLVKVQAADLDPAAVARALDHRREEAEARVALFDAMIGEFLGGRDEREFVRAAERVGPYLNLRRGRDFEAENIAWYRWAAAALRGRVSRS
jgi:DNA-binding PadR family transcriptional regulator